VQDAADEVERAWLAEQGEGEVSITQVLLARCVPLGARYSWNTEQLVASAVPAARRFAQQAA
jgi:hypothetical protein